MPTNNFVDFSDFFSGRGSEIYSKCEKTLTKFSMTEKLCSGVLVGLSGGADSVMLLSFLLEYRKRHKGDFKIICVHVNHCIRGEEADFDENFCRCLCDEVGVDLIVKKIAVPKLAKNLGIGIEEAARDARYSCFNEIIQGRNDIGTIAVAHNMSDNAETALFNILRGSGSRGGAGIPPVRENIIRPLIEVSKTDILSALDEGKISYVTDSTNLSNDYSRNYIRNEIIPRLDKLIIEPEKMISRFSSNLRADDEYITSVAERFLADNEILLNSSLKNLHYSVYARVISLLAKAEGAGISSRIISDIHNLLDKDNFSYSLIGERVFVCERGVCFVRESGNAIPDYHFDISEGVTDLSPFAAEFVLSREKINESFLNVYNFSIQVSLSSAIIEGSLYIRPKVDGDSIYYGGMTHKVKKLFSDRKIPASKRKQIPLLCDSKGVVWVPGCGVRDDGAFADKREDIFVLLGTLSKDEAKIFDLFSANEF